MIPILQTSTDAFQFGRSSSSIDISSLMYILFFAVLIFFLVIVLYLCSRVIRKWLHSSNEWTQLQSMLRHSSLTREEAFLLKQVLKENHVKHPIEVMQDIRLYKRWVEEPLKKVGSHKKHLLTSIREKIFGTKTVHQEMI